ncbi:MAG: DNA-3-methyladenine glycosylase I [Vampirovibrionales bacterium]|nr:DNA-3-methyladenine glycosylase I [Vampirovibrionales bacterium]
MTDLIRCSWAKNPLAVAYHDDEWGVPVYDDKKHFEFLILEAAQAGLSWDTVLKKREGYREAFCDFDVASVSKMAEAKVLEKNIERLMQNPGIIRNRLKINAAISNALPFMAIQEEFGSFSNYIWRFVEGKPIVNGWRDVSQLPATSPESVALSKDLKKRGFRFVGPTVMYAHMQATGLVNDHLLSCFRYQ